MTNKPTYSETEGQPPRLQTPRQRIHFAAKVSIGLALAALLYLVSRANYPLFHSIVDAVTVFIAAGVFLVVWHGRRRLDNAYYLFIAIAFLAFALLDFMHLIGNKGMGVFPEYGNLGPTFYIASRYVLGGSFLLAPLFIKRKLSTVAAFAAFLLVVLLVLLSVLHWRNFPATFIEGVGLTPFKVYSDYAVCLMLLGGLGLLLLNRRAFEVRVLKLIAFSLVLSIATGLAFTLYSDPFGIANAVGHFFQMASFYLIYLGFVETVLTKPQDILYRALGESEARLQQALGVSRSFTFEWLPATDDVLRSTSCRDILGLRGDESHHDTAQHYFQRVHPDDRARFVGMLRDLTPAASAYAAEYRLMRGDGSIVVLEEVGQAAFDAAGRLERLVGVATDITARKQAAAELERTTALLETLLAQAPLGFCYFDRALRYVRINERLAAMNGVAVADTIGRTAAEVVPALAPTAREITDGILETGEAVVGHEFSGETPAQPGVTRNWSESWYPVREAGGAIAGFGVIVEEITERREAEKRLRVATESARAGMWSMDIRAQRWEFSPQAARVYGLPDEEAPTFERIMELTHPDDRARLAEQSAVALAAAGEHEFEYRIVRPSGEIRWILLRGRTDADAEGRPWRNMGVVMDITQRQQTQEAIRKTAADLQAANAALRESQRATLNLMEDAIEARNQMELLARFPKENPNPVLRVSKDGRVLHANPAAAGNSRWTCEDGASLSDPLRALVEHAIAMRAPIEQDVDLEERTYTVAVALFPDDRYVNLYGRDVTERRRAEQREQEAVAVAAASQTAVDILDAMGEGVLLLDMNGGISSVNRALEKMAGIPAGELIGRPLRDMLPELLS